ncbi:hypothetical protein JL39_08070 [Rhizobium sp. YS-1r]|nr:hypothetical protein JL39_08070 [Rhizobium sp. YS-1r]
MVSFSGQSKRLALFLLIPMLSGCVEGGPGPGGYYPPQRPPRPEPQPQMCTMEYRPVCGERGGRFETFGNACQARGRGFRIVSSGECRRQPGPLPPPGRPDRPDRPDWNQPGRPDRPDRPGRPEQSGFCTREYRPVCGQRGSRTQTFPNACEAANAGFSVVASGECRR